MRIAVLTSARFHLLDLARELSALGHQIRFYSLLPPSRTTRYGLDARENRWLGVPCAPFYGAVTLAPARARNLADRALLWALDQSAAALLEPCDVLIALSGLSVRTIDAARKRYGAVVFLERGSRHILSQRAILAAMPQPPSALAPWFPVEREMRGYDSADVVSVPARHVVESFVEQGFPAERLFQNPYGVSLDAFIPTPEPPADPPTILMTGAWSLRKGCDVLTTAWRSLRGVRLLHVGSVGDAPLPRDPGFEHVDSVPQSELPQYYAQAHVFALASREEGLALVQAQALASGVRLVCTTRTGGADLKPLTLQDDAITVVPPDHPEALAAALRRALDRREPSGRLRDLLGANRDQLSWSAYGRRYEQRILEEVARRRVTSPRRSALDR